MRAETVGWEGHKSEQLCHARNEHLVHELEGGCNALTHQHSRAAGVGRVRIGVQEGMREVVDGEQVSDLAKVAATGLLQQENVAAGRQAVDVGQHPALALEWLAAGRVRGEAVRVVGSDG